MPVDRLPRIPAKGPCMGCGQSSFTLYCDRCVPPSPGVLPAEERDYLHVRSTSLPAYRRNGTPVYSTPDSGT